MVTGSKEIDFPMLGATKKKEAITMINEKSILIHYAKEKASLSLG